MNKINSRIEDIFSHAVALEQSGRMKNKIYALNNSIFIMNFDRTVLLRFLLRKNETSFKNPVSFWANDYDGNQFYEEAGKIIFIQENDGFVRKKSCGTPEESPEDIDALFNSFSIPENNILRLPKTILELMDENLSHIEISTVEKQLFFIQQNIYSGARIEITRKAGKGFDITNIQDSIQSDFGPIGMRTGDFAALFSFSNNISFQFNNGLSDYCYVVNKDRRCEMEGFVSHCLYDELGQITESRR